MAAYSIQFRSRGKIRTIEVNAPNEASARSRAKKMGTVLRVSNRTRIQVGGGMSAADRYIFLVRLSTMLASKVGGTEALKLLRDTFGGSISSCAAGLLEKAELGMDLPKAIGEDKRNFPGAIGLIIEVGSQSGQTWRALKQAADFEKEMNEVKRGSGKGIMSAVISFVIAGVLMIFSTMYIGPKVMGMSLMSSNKDMVNLTIINAAAKWGGISMVVILVIFFALFWLATVGKKFFPIWADSVILKIPYYSEMVLAQGNYINLHRLALLIRAGVRMENALQTSYDSSPPGALKADFGRALDSIRKGQKWATGMKTLHATDRAALLLSSDRDQIAQNLENLASQYQSLYIQRISTFAPMLQIAAAFSITLAGMVLFGQSVLPMLQVSAGMLK